jgi:hypothetical protein
MLAIDEVFPRALRQQCLAHKLRNLTGRSQLSFLYRLVVLVGWVIQHLLLACEPSAQSCTSPCVQAGH